MSSPLVHTPYDARVDLVPFDEASVPLPSTKQSAMPSREHPTPVPSSCGASLTDGIEEQVIQHDYLSGQCEYLEITSDAILEPVLTTNRLFKLFIGHVKFETTAPQLRWIVYMLTGVTCGKIETRGLGCFMVFFQNYEEMWKVKGLHKRALFDHHGVWFARNQLQEEILQHYVEAYLTAIDHSHLPNGLMVVDEETSRKRNKHKAGRLPPKELYQARPPMLAPGYVPTPTTPWWWGMMQCPVVVPSSPV